MSSCDFNQLCSHLPNLKSLSSLNFMEANHDADKIPLLVAAVACCTALQLLSLATDNNREPVPGCKDCFAGFSALTSLTDLSLKNTWALCRYASLSLLSCFRTAYSCCIPSSFPGLQPQKRRYSEPEKLSPLLQQFVVLRHAKWRMHLHA